MAFTAMGARDRMGGDVGQTVEAFPIRVDSHGNEMLRGRAADHYGTHRVLHVVAELEGTIWLMQAIRKAAGRPLAKS